MQAPEFDVFGSKYKIGRMNAMQQFHVARRLHGVCAALGEAFNIVQQMGGAETLALAVVEKKPTSDVLRVLAPVLKSLGDMKDTDVDYVFENCLLVVERQQSGGAWAPIWVRGGGLMFQDIEMPHMIVLTWHVLRSNLAGFFFELLSGLTAPGMESSITSASSAEKTTG